MDSEIYIGDEWPTKEDPKHLIKLLKMSKEEIIFLASGIIQKLQHPDDHTATCERCVNLDVNKEKYVRPFREKPCHRCFEYGEI